MTEFIILVTSVVLTVVVIVAASLVWTDAISDPRYLFEADFCYNCPRMWCDSSPGDLGCERRVTEAMTNERAAELLSTELESEADPEWHKAVKMGVDALKGKVTRTAVWEQVTTELKDGSTVSWYACSECGAPCGKTDCGTNYFSSYCPECAALMQDPKESLQ